MTQESHMLPDNEEPEVLVRRLLAEVQAVAASLPFEERATLLRNLVKAVRDAVKFGPLPGGVGPRGTEDELQGMATVGDAAENYYYNQVLGTP